MCNFASFVLTKDSCFYLPDSESHSKIIARHNIVESGVRGLNVVKVEITPPSHGVIDLQNLDQWDCKFDQDQFPEWHDAGKSESRARFYLLEKLQTLTHLDASDSNITDVSALVNLTQLYARGSNITDVSALVNLTQLDASYSKITDVSALVNLTTLYASGSKILNTWKRKSK